MFDSVVLHSVMFVAVSHQRLIPCLDGSHIPVSYDCMHRVVTALYLDSIASEILHPSCLSGLSTHRCYGVQVT